MSFGEMNQMNCSQAEFVVSAIVSVYNAERYLEGCLDDLLSQSIADKLEIIVVDSGSEQNEAAIIHAYQKHHDNINYIRTAKRETVYEAWNRGIRLARGRYITNANADDRHRKDSLEIMAHAMDQRPDIALVYADLLITETENETFEQCTPTGRFGWLDWDRQKLLEGNCFMGPQPMWRRSLHEEYGYFRPCFVTSGDYEFWLRISQTHEFLHLPMVLGLYLKSASSIEHSNRESQTRENLQILQEYREAAERGVVLHRKSSEVAFGPHPEPCPPRVVGASSNELIEKAWDEYWRGDIDRASALLERIDFSRQADTALVAASANLYMEMGAHRQTLNLVTKACSSSASMELAVLKVRALIGLGEYENAAQALRKSSAQTTDFAPLFTAKGLLNLELADYAQAVGCFEKAIADNPDDADAHINLGLAYLELGEAAAAFDVAKRGFLITNPTHSNIIKMSRVVECGVASKAIEKPYIDRLFAALIDAHPHNKVLIYQYISSLLSEERFARALEYIELAIIRFGYEDGILQHGRRIRDKIGPINLVSGSIAVGSISLCALVGNDGASLAKRLAMLKGQVDEIILVAVDAAADVFQIAQTFGAQIYNIDDYPQIENPWDLATQMAAGESCIRIDLRSTVGGYTA